MCNNYSLYTARKKKSNFTTNRSFTRVFPWICHLTCLSLVILSWQQQQQPGRWWWHCFGVPQIDIRYSGTLNGGDSVTDWRSFSLVLSFSIQFVAVPCCTCSSWLFVLLLEEDGGRGGPLMSIKRGGWIILFGKRNKKRYYRRRRRIKEQRTATRYKKTRHDPRQEIWREARDETVIVRFQSGG